MFSYIAISHVITRVAVPVFYIISGYFFFKNFRIWSWEGYLTKMRKRIKSLVIPYLMWNLILFCIVHDPLFLGELSDNSLWSVLWEWRQKWHVFWDVNIFDCNLKNILGGANYGTGPIDLPLWFLRDLIVVSFLSPLLYFFLKKARVWGVVFLLTAFVTRIWIKTPGFSITAFFFWGLGAYFAINDINIVLFSRNKIKIFLPITIMLIPMCVYYDGWFTDVGANIFQFYLFFCSFCNNRDFLFFR